MPAAGAGRSATPEELAALGRAAYEARRMDRRRCQPNRRWARAGNRAGRRIWGRTCDRRQHWRPMRGRAWSSRSARSAYGCARVLGGHCVGSADQVFREAQRHGGGNHGQGRSRGADADDASAWLRWARHVSSRMPTSCPSTGLTICAAMAPTKVAARISPAARPEQGVRLGIRPPGIDVDRLWAERQRPRATIGGVRFRWRQNRTASCRISAPRITSAVIGTSGSGRRSSSVVGLWDRADALTGNIQRHLRRHELDRAQDPGHPARGGRVHPTRLKRRTKTVRPAVL